MCRARVVDALLWLPAILVVAVEHGVWRPVRGVLSRLHRIEALRRLHDRLAALPPGAALPLFLVPEGASRAGWLASAWLLLNGAAWEALLVYVLTKLLASLTALWVYTACAPALLRVAWFARAHGAVLRMRGALFPPNSRFAALRHRLRVSYLP